MKTTVRYRTWKMKYYSSNNYNTHNNSNNSNNNNNSPVIKFKTNKII